MKSFLPVVVFILLATPLSAQPVKVLISGRVVEAKTKAPLVSASVSVPTLEIKKVTDADGRFSFYVPESFLEDSLVVSHVGYKTWKTLLSSARNDATILLEGYSIALGVVTITSRKFNAREIDRSLKKIRDNLYAYESETTNAMYNLFLGYLEEQGEIQLLQQCDNDLSAYPDDVKQFYIQYTSPHKSSMNNDTVVMNYSRFPAVNVSHTSAMLFCKWLTIQYNVSTGKKKFKKVTFRLPTLQEWQIAALGYPEFQSWNVRDNKVEVVIPADTVTGVVKGRKQTVPVGEDILYPWWSSYHYRRKVQNNVGCFMGNFRIPDSYTACDPSRPGKDGWIMMAQTASYFANGFGLYDVVGNVAEMIDEEGKACGGSWKDTPEESTIHSVKTYTGSDESVGFRVFMEAHEQ